MKRRKSRNRTVDIEDIVIEFDPDKEFLWEMWLKYEREKLKRKSSEDLTSSPSSGDDWQHSRHRRTSSGSAEINISGAKVKTSEFTLHKSVDKLKRLHSRQESQGSNASNTSGDELSNTDEKILSSETTPEFSTPVRTPERTTPVHIVHERGTPVHTGHGGTSPVQLGQGQVQSGQDVSSSVHIGHEDRVDSPLTTHATYPIEVEAVIHNPEGGVDNPSYSMDTPLENNYYPSSDNRGVSQSSMVNSSSPGDSIPQENRVTQSKTSQNGAFHDNFHPSGISVDDYQITSGAQPPAMLPSGDQNIPSPDEQIESYKAPLDVYRDSVRIFEETSSERQTPKLSMKHKSKSLGASIDSDAFLPFDEQEVLESKQEVLKPEVPRQEEEIEVLVLHRLPGEKLGMGLSIESTKGDNDPVKGVYVENVTPGGAADRATGGRHGLCVGDEILQVNGTPLREVSYSETVTFFKEMPLRVMFMVRRYRQPELELPPESIINPSGFGTLPSPHSLNTGAEMYSDDLERSARSRDPDLDPKEGSEFMSSISEMPNSNHHDNQDPIANHNTESPANHIQESTTNEIAESQSSPMPHRDETRQDSQQLLNSNPSPDVQEAPTGFEVVTYTIQRKRPDESLGLSIVPSYGSTSQYYQVSQCS